MNKDLLNIIERYSIQNNIANCNKQYRKLCQFRDDDEHLGYKVFNNKCGNMYEYNYRYLEYGYWNVSDIYDLYFNEVAKLPKNY